MACASPSTSEAVRRSCSPLVRGREIRRQGGRRRGKPRRRPCGRRCYRGGDRGRRSSGPPSPFCVGRIPGVRRGVLVGISLQEQGLRARSRPGPRGGHKPWHHICRRRDGKGPTAPSNAADSPSGPEQGKRLRAGRGRAAQAVLSRWQHGFESRWGHQNASPHVTSGVRASPGRRRPRPRAHVFFLCGLRAEVPGRERWLLVANRVVDRAVAFAPAAGCEVAEAT